MGYFLPSPPPLTKLSKKLSKNQNFKKTKKQKTPGDIILYMCTKNYDFMLCGSWAMVRDGEMDGKSDIEVAAPPRTNQYFSNRVQLSLGWKKKRIVNQIFLFKLWYIGQIYTIPTFIKEKIVKTIAQLSI